MEWFYLLLTTVGAVIGSFLSALSYRFPLEISVVSGRSFCPNCKKQIDWYDNIPVISFILLHGRCRKCRRKISRRYPVIEIGTALTFLFIGHLTPGEGPALGFLLFIASLLIFIFIVDWETRTIPDEAVFLGFFAVVVYSLFAVPSSLFLRLAAGFIASDILLTLHIVTKGRGMGLGDVKLALLLGMLVGLRLVLVWLFFAFLTGAVWGAILIIGGKAKLKSAVAFGPFLIISLVPALFWGEKFLSWLF